MYQAEHLHGVIAKLERGKTFLVVHGTART